MFEIERKFELSAENFVHFVLDNIYTPDTSIIEQCYIPCEKGMMRARKQKGQYSDSYPRYYLTIKSGKCEEHETSIDENLYKFYLANSNKVLSKLRMNLTQHAQKRFLVNDYVNHRSIDMCIDKFPNGKLIIELEYMSNELVEFPAECVIPTWFGQEIFESNYSMLCKGLI